MIVQFSQYLGEVVNVTDVNGKAFIFRIKTDDAQLECVLFVHPTLESFVTISEDIKGIDLEVVKQNILNTYKYEDLLTYSNEDKEHKI